MQIEVNFLENLKLEAVFDDFKILTDQPVRYKGDGLAPSPFDYFLASSALCAAYFAKVYCNSRNIPTEDIRLCQDNIIDPENRYNQTFKIQIELPDSISEKDKAGILKSIERCTVKKTIQQAPQFVIEAISTLGKDKNNSFIEFTNKKTQTHLIGKDSPLEDSISKMIGLLEEMGIKIEISSWRNPVPHVWSVHIRDADSPQCYTNGKGRSKEAALCSALGEYFERLSSNYFYADYYLGQEIAEKDFAHYPNEKWFPINNEALPNELMDDYLKSIYDENDDLSLENLIDTNSSNHARGVCAIPFIRQSDKQEVYIPVNLIGNLFVSNGMSAGNSKYEARVQCLSEIFERAVKNHIIKNEIALPDVPPEVIDRFPQIKEGIRQLEEKGFPIFVKDASLDGIFPVLNVTLMNPKTGGVFASFGAHPNFEVALERSLTELLQGRSFEGLDIMPAPSFNSFAVQEHNNIVDHFIDSSGIISWKFFSQKHDHSFVDWNFQGSTEEEFHYLMQIFQTIEKEVYIADYNDLGVAACRIIVPNYSEIYEKEDLVWDNNNRAVSFRSDILNLHRLSTEELTRLYQKLEDFELDLFMPITELIGIPFEENSVWGQLVVCELMVLINLALNHQQQALEHINLLINYENNTMERKRFFQLLNILLEINIDTSLDIEDYYKSLAKMYPLALLQDCIKLVKNEIRFYGLEEINEDLGNLEKFQRLLGSYNKIYNKRSVNLNK